ncbi:MAG: 30S ribosomal protein S8 [bacterium]|nr:30S ribosomal protein S8 [bacterium]
MSMTDPIADLLVRVRNALQAKHETVDIPMSRVKVEIVKILAAEGYVDGYSEVEAKPRNLIRVELKYVGQGDKAINGLERVSRPGRRIYCGKSEIPKVLNGLGVNILSTSRGIMTGRACRDAGLGGEILCQVW